MLAPGELPHCGRVATGEITAGHARVARVAAYPGHADEPALLEMARGHPVDMFGGAVLPGRVC